MKLSELVDTKARLRHANAMLRLAVLPEYWVRSTDSEDEDGGVEDYCQYCYADVKRGTDECQHEPECFITQVQQHLAEAKERDEQASHV